MSEQAALRVRAADTDSRTKDRRCMLSEAEISQQRSSHRGKLSRAGVSWVVISGAVASRAVMSGAEVLQQ